VTIILFSSILIGIGINGFIVPIQLLNGGFWGVSLIIHYLLGFKIAITFALLNIPIYLFAGFYDRDYFVNGIMGISISSIIIALLSPVQFLWHLPTLWSVIYGGISIGIGVGIMLRNDISPGGIDLLALILSKRFSLNVGITLLALGSFIILLGVFILGDIRLLYSFLVVALVGVTATFLTIVKRVILYV
jgi:uncharacterized membrane-anchored protein YitT (DUF2179 family)